MWLADSKMSTPRSLPLCNPPFVNVNGICDLLLRHWIWQTWWAVTSINKLHDMIPILLVDLFCLTGFGEVSFHEVSGHAGDSHGSKSCRWSLGALESLQQESESFSPEVARIRILSATRVSIKAIFFPWWGCSPSCHLVCHLWDSEAEYPANAVPRLLTTRHCEISVCCFKPLSVVIWFATIEN